MTVFVLSTMTNGVNYRTYRNLDGLPVVEKSVLVHGGTGLPSYKSGIGEMTRDEEGKPMWMADGVVTPVSDEDYAVLKDHWLFKKHLDHGHVKVLNKDIRGNHREVQKQVSDMTRRDSFAQLTPDTAAKNIKITTGKKSLEPESQFRI